jgi:hypothetical protein
MTAAAGKCFSDHRSAVLKGAEYIQNMRAAGAVIRAAF